MNATTQPPQGVMAPKVGDRVMHVLGTDYDDYCITPGDSGTVIAVDDDGDVNVQWDNPKDARFGGDWYIAPESLKPYERTYSEAEYSALLARCEGLEAALVHMIAPFAHTPDSQATAALLDARAALAATRTTGD